MTWQGNYNGDSLVYFSFTSRDGAGQPALLEGSPALAVYIDDAPTQSVAGLTLTVDFNGVTGQNWVKIDTSSDAFYAVGGDFSVQISAGTVGGVDVAGETVGSFAIENRFTRGTDGANTVVPNNAGIASNSAAISALNNITVAEIMAGGDIDGFTLEDAFKIALAALAGKLSGADTITNIIRAADDSKVRITATMDTAGNRTDIILDGTG